MESPLRCSIIEQIDRFLDGDIALDALRDWQVALLWSDRLKDDPAAEKLVWQIEGSYAEFSSGHMTIEEFRRRLRSLTSTPLRAGSHPADR